MEILSPNQLVQPPQGVGSYFDDEEGELWRTLGPWSFSFFQRRPDGFRGFINGCWTKNRGFPPEWMVYFMETPIKMDDLGGFPIFLEGHPNG